MDQDVTLADGLEPGRRAGAALAPLPRRRLGRGVLTLLIVLRVYVVIAIPIVAYAFIHALGVAQP